MKNVNMYANGNFQIKVDKNFERQIADGLEKELNTFPWDENEIHATDFVFCPAKTIHRFLKHEKNLKEKDVFILSFGKTHHRIIQDIRKDYGFQEVKVQKNFGGVQVTATIDMLEDGIPIEIKSTRKRISQNNFSKTIPMHYIKQLSVYCAICEKEAGKLLIWSLNTAELLALDVKFSKDFLRKIENEIVYKLQFFTLPEEDLKNYPEFPLKYPEYSWECNLCRYRNVCKVKKKQ